MILRMRRLPYRCEFSGRRGVDRESGRAGAEAGDGGGLIRVESCGAATGDGEWGEGLPFPGRSGFPCARARRRACCHAQLRMLLQRWVGVGLCFAVRRGKARQAGRAITESRTRINPLPTQQGGRPSTRTAALQAGCCFEAKRAGLLGGFVWTQSEAYSVRRSKHRQDSEIRCASSNIVLLFKNFLV
jgi:hypothetical protein